MILTGWKEISNHLRYGVRTVQRWERTGLPVKRVNNSPRSPVVADSEELDAWILHRSRFPQEAPQGLLDKFRRAKKSRDDFMQRKRQFRQQVQAFKKEEADFRARKHK